MNLAILFHLEKCCQTYRAVRTGEQIQMPVLGHMFYGVQFVLGKMNLNTSIDVVYDFHSRRSR